VFLGILAIFTVFVFAIGSLVVSQVRNFVDEAPEYVQNIEDWINDTFDANVDFDDLADEFNDPEGPARQFVEDLAGSALEAGVTALAVVFQTLTIALFTFYLVADGPRLRRPIASKSCFARGSSPSTRRAATSIPVSSWRDCRPASTGSRSRSSTFHTHSRSHCGSASSRSSSRSSVPILQARSRCSSRC
jgi:hypothetical protein